MEAKYVKNVDNALAYVKKRVDVKAIVLMKRILKMIKIETMRVIKEDAYDTGNLYSSIRTQVFARVARQTLQLMGRVYVDEATAPYYAAVHEGRGKGKIPPKVENIKEWLIRRGIKPTVTLKRASGYGTIKYLPTMDQFAFMIARSIGRKGFKGVKFFDKGLRRATPKINAEVMKAGFTFKRDK